MGKKKRTRNRNSYILAWASGIVILLNVFAIFNQNNTAIKSERNVRFTNAIEQLGSNENAIVLGGIYTLHRIAQEERAYRENVFNILCAYVRETTTTQEYQSKYIEKPAETIQTIVNLLSKKGNKQIYDKYKIDFSGAYLFGIDLTDADLSEGRFVHTNFSSSSVNHSNFSNSYSYNAIFENANLLFVDFSKSKLRSSSFSDSYMLSTNFSNSDLSFTDLSKINTSKTNFTKADLSHANFVGATLEEGNFTKADLSSSDLRASSLYKAIFKETNLSGADLKGADAIQQTRLFLADDFIRTRIGKTTDLSGINGGYSADDPPFTGIPIVGFFTMEEAEQIINPKTLQERLTDLNDDLVELNNDLRKLSDGFKNLVEEED